jgi:glycosyltransferase involved in cell wall biosynthesis
MRNEAKILPYFIKWYKTFAEKIFVFDDKSDDGTREILLQSGVYVKDYPGDMLDDGAMAKLFSHCYREDRSADYVICVDADEFVWAPNLKEQLQVAKENNLEVLSILGYEMWAYTFPFYYERQLPELIQHGDAATWWHNGGYKPCIFDPKINMAFGCGRHYQTGSRETKIASIKLLHYRNLGHDYYLWHHQRNAARLSPERADLTWGQHNYRPMGHNEFNENVRRVYGCPRICDNTK